jgi:nucleotide-binding universal stress UspA family protein
MLKLQKILCPTDFSTCAEQALTQAIDLAKKYQAQLSLLHASVLYTVDYIGNAEEIYEKLKEIAIDHMQMALERRDTSGITLEQVHAPAVSASVLILEYAENNEVDLIVIGTHGRRGLGHLLLGSIAEQVVRLAPCPVLTIHGSKDPMANPAINHILVPIDFSQHSQKALRYAKELAATYNAQLDLLHVIEEPIYPSFYVFDRVSSTKPMLDIEIEAQEELKRWIKELELPLTSTNIHVINGHAARDITKFAQENGMDMIVIATHGLTGIQHLLLGSVTEKVVRLATCPVFTIKAFGKSLLADKENA